MYDVIFESLRKLKGIPIGEIVKITGCKSEYIMSVESGKEPSTTFLLEMASYYGVALKDINLMNNMDNENVALEVNRIERCNRIKRILRLYYNQNIKIGESIEARKK